MADLVRLIVYAFLAASCWSASRTVTHGDVTRRVLSALALLFIAVAVGQNLAIGEHAAMAGRRVLGYRGWYGERRALQAAVVGVVALAGTLSAGLLAGRLWRFDRALVPLTAGAAGLVTFVVLRAISLHQFDQVFYRHLAGQFHTGDLAELLLAGALAAWVRMAFRGPAAFRRLHQR